MPGRPGPQWTSTRTSGASMPRAARARTVAFDMFDPPWSVTDGAAPCRAGSALLRRLQRGLELDQPRAELLEAFARARQHLLLHLELLARDDIELAERGREHAAEVRLEVALHLAHTVRHRGRELARQFVQGLRVDGHGLTVDSVPPEGKVTSPREERR